MATEEAVVTELLPRLIKASALTFGTYTLKSGRISPYFVNSAQLFTSSLLGTLARAYAATLASPPFSLPEGTEEAGAASSGKSKPHFDILFGPAYKGIPLCAIAARELDFHGPAYEGVAYSFNRKEAKDHGEGGTIVGAPLKGRRVVVLDDVITSGKALREAISIIRHQGGIVVGVVVLMTRQERASDTEPRSAMKVAEVELGVPIRAVLKFEDIIKAIEDGRIEDASPEQLQQMYAYRERYRSRD
ncbi:hypothetical protein DV736_g5708, partial [Chaetothyriales sp. CBS 134916]